MREAGGKMTAFGQKYEEYRAHFEAYLQSACKAMAFEPSVLTESMRYSLLSGGKRVRPVLFFAALEAFGMPYCGEEGLAFALECIHTYSLIHDDLPAMDDDDMRRGRPSNHKVFGEANAILAGDALLSYAFDLMLREAGRSARHLAATKTLSKAAGAEGMVAGQSADLLYTGKNGGERELAFIYQNKTGRLMAAPVAMAADLAGKKRGAAEAFGLALGTLFQLTDDILDEVGESGALGKSVGKDAAEDKLTAVKIYGLEGAKTRAEACAEQCLALLRDMGAKHGFLHDLVAHLLKRDR